MKQRKKVRDGITLYLQTGQKTHTVRRRTERNFLLWHCFLPPTGGERGKGSFSIPERQK